MFPYPPSPRFLPANRNEQQLDPVFFFFSKLSLRILFLFSSFIPSPLSLLHHSFEINILSVFYRSIIEISKFKLEFKKKKKKVFVSLFVSLVPPYLYEIA